MPKNPIINLYIHATTYQPPMSLRAGLEAMLQERAKDWIIASGRRGPTSGRDPQR